MSLARARAGSSPARLCISDTGVARTLRRGPCRVRRGPRCSVDPATLRAGRAPWSDQNDVCVCVHFRYFHYTKLGKTIYKYCLVGESYNKSKPARLNEMKAGA